MDPSTDEHEHKLVSYKTYINVWLALVFLTFITVAVSFTDMKHMTIFTAVLVAMIKSTLVMLYFMNIRFERPVNAVELGTRFPFGGLLGDLLSLLLSRLDQVTGLFTRRVEDSLGLSTSLSQIGFGFAINVLKVKGDLLRFAELSRPAIALDD